MSEPTDITPEIREKIRRTWVEMLRSGEFQQGTGTLNRNGKFCCLGVACEAINRVLPGKLTVEKHGPVVTYDGWTSALPETAMSILGVRTASADFHISSLAAMNDCGETFSQIADVIESHPNGLFID